MHARDPWGGPLELTFPDQSPTSDTTDDTHSSWLLSHDREPKNMNKNHHPGRGLLKYRILCWVIVGIVVGVVVAAVVVVRLRGGRERRVRVDVYGEVLGLGLSFFDAQRSGPLPKHNNISWRGNSGMKDGLSDSEVHMNLVGGFYDGGNAMKFNFPASFSMTMLSWSVIEYGDKYKHAGELDHVKEIIKWGADYFLKTFNSSANTIDSVIAQVGVGNVDDKSPNDEYCWTRPEDIDYPRPVYKCYSCSDLAAEMTAALASAAIVFRNDLTYSKKLKHGAETLWKFARSRPGRYSAEANAAQFYNSTSYWDELIWGGTWLYYATGNTTYLSLVVSDYANARDSNVFHAEPNYEIFGWDKKIGGAQLLLTRMRLFLNPGFPEEELLRAVHDLTSVSMCSYLTNFTKYRRTKGGLIQLNHGGPKPLQYVANAAFLASLYADYLTATDTPGWYCGPYFYRTGVLREFAKLQIDYILGKNPNKMSYVVGYGNRYPRYAHHRGASIPNDREKYSCKGGWKWRDSKRPNPNTIIGAMVGGPDREDSFRDVRTNQNYTEPTLAGNAGLVAVSVSLSGNTNSIDTNSMFAFVTPMRFPGPPPPEKWNP